MQKELKNLLRALREVKQLPDEFGGRALCFGCYNTHNEACWRRAQGEGNETRVCVICRRLTTTNGADWIDEEIKRG